MVPNGGIGDDPRDHLLTEQQRPDAEGWRAPAREGIRLNANSDDPLSRTLPSRRSGGFFVLSAPAHNPRFPARPERETRIPGLARERARPSARGLSEGTTAEEPGADDRANQIGFAGRRAIDRERRDCVCLIVSPRLNAAHAFRVVKAFRSFDCNRRPQGQRDAANSPGSLRRRLLWGGSQSNRHSVIARSGKRSRAVPEMLEPSSRAKRSDPGATGQRPTPPWIASSLRSSQ